jgi:hypothetical protein
MAVHNFGLPFQNPAAINAGNITADTQLNTDGASVVIFNPNAALNVAMPDPTKCNGMIREIVNASTTDTNTLTVRQYVSPGSLYTGAPIELPDSPASPNNGNLSATSSTVAVTGARYRSARYYCNGSTWTLLSANINAVTA